MLSSCLANAAPDAGQALRDVESRRLNLPAPVELDAERPSPENGGDLPKQHALSLHDWPPIFLRFSSFKSGTRTCRIARGSVPGQCRSKTVIGR